MQRFKSYFYNSCPVMFGCIGIACILGICVDLITANVAVEYFSVFHPKVIESDNPWALAVVWGIGASWWFGAICGLILAFINHRRSDRLPTKLILKWVSKACVGIWVTMMLVLAGVLALSELIPKEQRKPAFEHNRRLFAVGSAHFFEYLFGVVALIVVARKTKSHIFGNVTAGAKGKDI